ncbi:hypothetical protein ASPZODRAFT_152616 [Penicilliopsis zonata CBS 506.65]|uniref:Transcription factor IIIC putative zinc-finger domain-containing protein n=1 Tax=Penicilliopsis zonata CBS 506.65 TaxID=1073090 RepID=A0A1L9SEN0_9EURO|nr:hypothetical protein ASPZODRAFT_152616 [Penicilliopsis zonata CBS 506.65]OJJ45563.1 hypothetical protein ASPZODRAFT_152616 [Penicilliopsis zonata CBS 506.65]
MLPPVELPLFPSCYNCISWSADGDIAVAAGDHVHILTPKGSDQGVEGHKTSPVRWQFTRVKVNVFTNDEWPTIYPQKRADFSIGAEQSMSTVVGLSWSPPGIAKHRRCLLAVLTSNMLLSLYEPFGPQAKWTRVAVVNHALRDYLSDSAFDEGVRLRKARVRAFTWSPPLQVPDSGVPHAAATPEIRWGAGLIALANDDNDIVVIHIGYYKAVSTSSNYYSMGILSSTSLQEVDENFSKVQTESILYQTLKSHTRVSSLACGPWIHHSPAKSASAMLAVVYGSGLQTIRVNVSMSLGTSQDALRPSYKLEARTTEHRLNLENGNIHNYQFTGPLQWLHQEGMDPLHLAAGVFAGLLTFSMPKSVYDGSSVSNDGIEMRETPFVEKTNENTQVDGTNHWEPIGAMGSVVKDKASLPSIHLGTMGGYTFASTFGDVRNQDSSFTPFWTKQLDDFRERFDIDRDLGGLAIVRVRGLASYKGIIAVAFTMHPGDVIEYRTAAEERTTLVFASATPEDELEAQLVLPLPPSNLSPSNLRSKREPILRLVLDLGLDVEIADPWSQRLLYAAVCCTIVDSENEELLSLAHKALIRLATITGADLSEEISMCLQRNRDNIVKTKTIEQLEGPGGQFYEKCEMCNAGLTWYSPQEAQCASGHLFVRCALTFISIQDPGISKFCSSCGAEYIYEGLIKPATATDLGPLYQIVSDTFDTCVQCGGKFRD